MCTTGQYDVNVFERPERLLSLSKDKGGKLSFDIHDDVLRQLDEISAPMSVVSIAGPYRTGKSYVMNKLAAYRQETPPEIKFPLCMSSDRGTKGILLWCRQHPFNKDHVIALIDTEGLDDCRLGDRDHDTCILSLSILLSSIFTYNHMMRLDGTVIDRISHAAKVATYSSSSGENRPLPMLLMAVRDFTSKLVGKDRKISADDYLEHAISLSKSTENVIWPGDALRPYFYQRKCFIFHLPAEGRNMFKLDTLGEEDLTAEFKQQSKFFCEFVLEQSIRQTSSETFKTGKGIVEQLRFYVEKFSGSGDITKPMSAIRKQHEWTMEEAKLRYLNMMFSALNFPVSEEDVVKTNRECRVLLEEHMIGRCVEDGNYEQKQYEKELKTKLTEIFGKLLEIKDNENLLELAKSRSRLTDEEYINRMVTLYESETKNRNQAVEESRQTGMTQEHMSVPLPKRQDPDGESALKEIKYEVESVLQPWELLLQETDKSGPYAPAKALMQFFQETKNESLKELLEKEIPQNPLYLNKLLKICLEHRYAPQSHVVLDKVCHLIREEEGDNCVNIYAAHQEDKFDPTIILLEKKLTRGEEDVWNEFKVLRRRYDLVSNEAETVMNDKGVLDNVEEMHLIDLKPAARLMDLHSNISFISACPFRSRNFKTEHELQKGVCVVIHCLIKGFIPFGEDEFPDRIGGLPVDVREGFCDFGMHPVAVPSGVQIISFQQPNIGSAPTDYNPELRMGTGIGPAEKHGRLTLGGFVRLCNGHMGFLTCTHDLLQQHDLMSQPSDESVGTPGWFPSYSCAEVKQVAFNGGGNTTVGLDCALVQITDLQRVPTQAEFIQVSAGDFANAGFDHNNKPNFSRGSRRQVSEMSSAEKRMAVVKFGSTTGVTRGVLSLDGTHARRWSDTYLLASQICPVTFFNQHEILSLRGTGSNFVDPGDSGSLVFQQRFEPTPELVCIGMVIGRTNYGSAVVTPIESILKHFNVDFVDFTARSPQGLASQVWELLCDMYNNCTIL